MININEVENIHNILIEKFGGAKGIRDKGILESAINRPYQTFDGQELYPSPIEAQRYDFVIKAAKGELTFDQIRTRIQINLK